MMFSKEDTQILNKLVGTLNTDTLDIMKRKIDCFIHPLVSLFIPLSGQCKYATTPNHTHPAYSFIYYFQPTNDIVLEGRNIVYDLSEGKCLSAISPEIPHQELEQESFQSYIAILIDTELFNNVIAQYIKEIPIFRGEAFAPHPELLGVLRCFMLESGLLENKNSELLSQLANVIVHLIVRSVISHTHSTIQLYDRFEVDRAIAYMNSHISEKITTEALAMQVNRSTGHFSKIFKSVTGSTPIDFLNMIRIQKARNMLINSMKNITEIALECGYNSSSYFSTCFIQKYKMTPTVYRQKFQKK